MATHKLAAGLNLADDTAELNVVDARGRLSVNAVRVCKDFEIDNSGYGIVRKAKSAVGTALAVSNVWTDGEIVLGKSGSNLVRINSISGTPTMQTLYPLVGSGIIDFAELPNGWIAFSNGLDIGYVQSGVASQFPYSAYEGDGTPPFKIPIPAGNLLGWFNGRLLVAKLIEGETFLFFTDGYQLDGVDYRNNYLRFPGAPKLLAPVTDGVWFSAGDKTYWLNGSAPESFTVQTVANFPAIPYTSECVDTAFTPIDGFSGQVQVWWGSKGFCVGGNNGSFKNVSAEKRVVPPNAVSGASAVRTDNGFGRYIALLANQSTTTDTRTDLSPTDTY